MRKLGIYLINASLALVMAGYGGASVSRPTAPHPTTPAARPSSAQTLYVSGQFAGTITGLKTFRPLDGKRRFVHDECIDTEYKRGFLGHRPYRSSVMIVYHIYSGGCPYPGEETLSIRITADSVPTASRSFLVGAANVATDSSSVKCDVSQPVQYPSCSRRNLAGWGITIDRSAGVISFDNTPVIDPYRDQPQSATMSGTLRGFTPILDEPPGP